MADPIVAWLFDDRGLAVVEVVGMSTGRFGIAIRPGVNPTRLPDIFAVEFRAPKGRRLWTPLAPCNGETQASFVDLSNGTCSAVVFGGGLACGLTGSDDRILWSGILRSSGNAPRFDDILVWSQQGRASIPAACFAHQPIDIEDLHNTSWFLPCGSSHPAVAEQLQLHPAPGRVLRGRSDLDWLQFKWVRINRAAGVGANTGATRSLIPLPPDIGSERWGLAIARPFAFNSGDINPLHLSTWGDTRVVTTERVIRLPMIRAIVADNAPVDETRDLVVWRSGWRRTDADRERSPLTIAQLPVEPRDIPIPQNAIALHGFDGRLVPAIWNERVAKPHLEAIAHVGAGRDFSSMPTVSFPDPSTNEHRWAAVLETDSAIAGAASTESYRVTRLGPTTAHTFVAEFAQLQSESGCSLKVVGDTRALRLAGIDTAAEEKRKRELLAVAVGPPEKRIRTLLDSALIDLEALALDIGDFTLATRFTKQGFADRREPRIRAGSLELELVPDSAGDRANDQDEPVYRARFHEGRNERSYDGVSLTTRLPIRRVRPGGQDGLPADEFVPVNSTLDARDRSSIEAQIERRFQRDATIVIPLEREADAPSVDTFYTIITEDTRRDKSLSIRWELHTNNDSGSRRTERAVVLDADPFLVGMVEFTDFTRPLPKNANLIAVWDNTAPEGASWRLAGDDAGTNLLRLPPQAVGEELIVQRAAGPTSPPSATPGSDTATGPLVDYRFGQTSAIALYRGEQQQTFAEAPWNLRRLLGFPGERTPGARIKSLQVEMLFGLSCRVDRPALRLAEIASRLGDIPHRLPRDPAWPTTLEQTTAFFDWRQSWSRTFAEYSSRIALLEPWNPADPDSLIIDTGISCLLRAADTEAATVPSDDPQGNGNRERPLRGGALRGVEVAKIYSAIIANPTSSSAMLANPAFSALGGYGFQKASFDNDLSSIYGHVSLGRTYDYTIERIGRIGVFANVAKYVVVFERTTLPSAQFAGDPKSRNEFDGRAVVRKVHEYIEILEPHRRFPDFGASPAAAGFVAGCEFPKGARINVLAEWGGDIGDGWNVPLWNEAYGKARPDIYPKPTISLTMLVDRDGKKVEVPITLAEPENVYFYTRTVPGSPSDTNDWPFQEGVDFALLRRPVPPPDSITSPDAPGQAVEPRVPPGFERFTFRVNPTDDALNLLAGRLDKSMNAVIETVTMIRDQGTEFADAAINGTMAAALAPAIATMRGTLQDSLASLLASLPTTLPADGRVSTADLLRTQDTVIKSLQTALATQAQVAQTEATNYITGLKQELKKRCVVAVDAFLHRASPAPELSAAINDFLESATRSLDELQPRTDRAKEALTVEINELFEEARRAVDALPFSPRNLTRLLHGNVARTNQLLGRLGEFVTELHSIETNLPAAPVAAEVRAVADLIRRRSDELTATVEVWRRELEPFRQGGLPTPLPIINWVFVPVREGASATASALAQTAAEMTAAEASAQTAISNAIQQIDDVVTRVRKTFTALHLIDFPDPLCEYLEDTRTKIILLVDSTDTKPWSDRVDAIKGQLAAALRAGTKELTTLFEAIEKEANDQCDKLVSLLATFGVEGLLGASFAKLAELGKQVADWLSGLSAKGAAIDVPGLRAELETLRHAMKAAGDAASTAASSVIRDANAIKDYAGKTLSLVRAFGHPPKVPSLDFNLDRIGYYFKGDLPTIDLTPCVAYANRIGDSLGALGINLPTKQLAERFIPNALDRFDFNKIFGDLAGLKVAKLFPGFKVPSVANDRIKIQHGVDPQAKRAWLDATMEPFTCEPGTIFSIGPLTLRVPTARMEATARISTSITTGEVEEQASAAIIGDWSLEIGGSQIVIVKSTRLDFDTQRGIRFSVDPRNVELPGAMKFISDLLAQLVGGDSGLTVSFIPGGVQSVLQLPIPDMQSGTTGISGLSLGATFALRFAPTFEISAGVRLAASRKPFALTVFILGGSGYIEAEAAYAPFESRLRCRVTVALMASASLAITLGPLHGGVYVYFGTEISFEVSNTNGASLTVGVVLIIRGEVDILGLVSACLCLRLEVSYGQSKLVARGELSISIKICWCFTLELHESIEYSLGCGVRSMALSAHTAGLQDHALVAAAPLSRDECLRLACHHIGMHT